MKKILISACLCGENVKYNGGNNKIEHKIIKKWDGEGRLIPVCPEVLGGLSVPRHPCEIVGENVMTDDGRNVTENFKSGAEQTLKLIKDCDEDNPIAMAVLKDGSPTCGSVEIYDGTFSGEKIAGMGITARLLAANGIKVFSERQLYEADDYLETYEADDEFIELMTKMFF